MNDKVQLGPDNRQEEAAECAMSFMNGEEEGEVKYVDLSQVREQSQPGIIFSWGIKGIGFGEFTLTTQEGEIVLDTECTGKETFLKVMGHLYDKHARH